MTSPHAPLNVLRRLRSHAISRRVDVVFLTDLDARDPPGRADRLELVAIGPEQRGELEAHVRRHHAEWQQSMAMIDDCYRLGFGGYLARMDGEAVGYRWWSGRDHAHPHYSLYGFRPEADEVYSFALHVAPQFRSQGYASEILAKMRRAQLALGYRRTWSVITEDNVPSIRVQTANGAREIARHTVVQLFGRYQLCRGRVRPLHPIWS